MNSLYVKEIESLKCTGSRSLMNQTHSSQYEFTWQVCYLHFKCSPKTPCSIIRICTVVIGEDMVVTEVAKNSSTMFPDLWWGFYPTGCF